MLYAKLAGLLAIVALSCYGTWYATSDHYQKVIAEKQIKTDQVVQKQLEENQKLLADKLVQQKSAEEKHANDQMVINDLAGKLSRMYVHIPSCGDMPADSQAGTGENGGSGVFPTAVDGLFGDLQARVGALVQRCDQLNIDTIRLNNEVK